MKVGKNYFEKTSFYSTEKDLALICQKILGDNDLLKLLYYSTRDCLSKPNLTDEQKMSMIDKQIKITPQLEINTDDCPIYLIITFNHFIPNGNNQEFRDNVINIYILCHPDCWHLGNFQLRPIKILGRLDTLFNKQKLTGIGTVLLDHASMLTMNKEFIGYEMEFFTIHGGEDKIDPNAEINGAGI